MLDLALKKGEDPVCISDIAVRQELPENYLEQLFSKLRRAGLVESTRGKKGGYRLSREPEAISVSEVILAVDASLKATACSSRRGCRHKGVTCLSHDLWEGLERHVESYLSAFSLKDVIKGKTDAINLFRGDLSHG